MTLEVVLLTLEEYPCKAACKWLEIYYKKIN